MIARLLRNLRLKREISRSIKARRVIRLARAEAARRGLSTEIKRRAEKARQMFGEPGR